MIPRIRLCILNRTGSKAFGARNQRRPSSDARGQESSRPLESGVNRTPTTPLGRGRSRIVSMTNGNF
jgi:hypothetical protein